MAQEYFHRTPTSSGNRKIFTYAGWFKKNNADGSARFDIFNAHNTGSQQEEIGFRADSLRYLSSGSSLYGFDTTNKYRDTGNWFHIVFALNTTLESERKRSVIYINGVEVDTTTSSGIGAYVAKNFDSIAFNVAGKEHNVLARKYSSSGRDYVEGGAFDIFFVDGQALTPDVFGFFKDGKGYQSSGTTEATDFRPGQWSPHSPRKIKTEIERKGGFGTNGFYLPMNDNSNPGADFHCTPNTIIKLKGEDLPQPRNGAPTTSDAFVSQLREEIGGLGFAGVVKFDGASDWLQIPDSNDFDMGTGDFTLETYVFSENNSNYQGIFGSYNYDNAAVLFQLDNQGRLRLVNPNNLDQIGTTSIWNNEWHHIAMVKTGSTLKGFVDGKEEISVSYTSSIDWGHSNNAITIGVVDRNDYPGQYDFKGYLSNLRLTKGTALYTSNFTPPTGPLTVLDNTKLLCCNSSTSATASTITPGTITAHNNVFATASELTGSIVAAIPGISGGTNSGYGDYSADIRGSGSNKSTVVSGNVAINTVMHSHYGSGMRFSGSGNSNYTGGIVYINSVSDFNMGLNDFTLEGWIYAHVNNQDSGVFGIGNGGAEAFLSWTNGELRWRQTGSTLITAPFTIAHGQWHHVVLQSRSQVCSLIVNGVTIGSTTNTHALVEAVFIIGSWTTGKQYGFDGDIQDVRLYKGIAKYKGGFDVPKPYAPVGIEDFRVVPDTCKNNFATLNPLIGAGTASGDTVPALKDGNLFLDGANQTQTQSSIGMSSGKWYCEYRLVGASVAATAYIGVVGDELSGKNNQNTYTSAGWSHIRPGTGSNSYTKNWTATSLTTENPALGFVSGDIFGFALDLDSSPKNIKYYRNGTLIHTDSTIGDSGHYYFLAMRTNDGVSGANWSDVYANFGQNPSFSGQVTAGTNADASGKGLFKYAVPSGFLALCEDNLSTPAIADPGKHFKCVIYTGDGTDGRGIRGVGFQPDLIWIKKRNNTSDHRFFDSVRGAKNALKSNSIDVEFSNNAVISFDNDGWSASAFNNTGDKYVAWCWKAGGPAVTNNDGSITSQVSANRTAGFSIVSYTGNNTTNSTVGHGLGKTPSVVITKSRSNTQNPAWHTSHVSLAPNYDVALDSTTAAWNPGSNGWHELTSSSVFTLKNGSSNGYNVNRNGDNYIAYCWTEIEGYSKFGSYKGNGNANGTFVYCGFKPAWIMIKPYGSGNGCYSSGYTSWSIYDSSRSPINDDTMHERVLFANRNYEEGKRGQGSSSGTFQNIDIVSNGFKIRGGSNCETNTTSIDGFIFLAFAESPFQTANAK